MASVYQQALGAAFDDLHPELQERYGFDSDDGVRCVGRGVMRQVESNRLARPALRVLAPRNLPFPETGTNVPFTVRSDAFDDDGRETLVLRRGFDIGGRERRFDARMQYDPGRDCVVDALGRDGRLVSELQPRVTDEGGLHIRAGEQYLRVGDDSYAVPSLLRAGVDVRERYDEHADCFRIAVAVRTPSLGYVFGYQGRFTIDWADAETVPDAVRAVGCDG